MKTFAAGVTGAVGITGSASGASVEDEYGSVIDVTEAGADDTGQESIVPVLEDIRQDDTLYRFPPGRYYIDEQLRYTDFENLGFVGDDATLVPADYDSFDGVGHRLFRLGTTQNPDGRVRFEGFTIDQTAPNTGLRVIDTVAEDRLTVRDVEIAGRHDSGMLGPGRFVVSDPSGTGVVERFRAPDGAEWIGDTPNAGTDEFGRGPTGIFANENRGRLRFANCDLGGFPSSGLYASGSTGQVVVEGGSYANSNVAQIRLGGPGSYVRWASIGVDDVSSRGVGYRGIRLERGTNLKVLNSEIVVTTTAADNYPISVHGETDGTWIEGLYIDVIGDAPNSGIVVSGDAGETTIYDVDIDFDVPAGYALWLQDGDDQNTVNCQRITITGDAGDEGARSAIFNERDGAEFRNVGIEQLGSPDRAAMQNFADDIYVFSCEFVSSDIPILEYGTGTWIEETYADAGEGLPAVRLGDQSADVLVKESTLPGGIQDLGCEGLRTWDNDY